MRIFNTSLLVNFFCLFIFFYLIYHSLHGQYNIQNYLISKYEKRMYEDFNYKLKQSLVDVNKDIFALHYSFDDMVDEIAKRKMPLPAKGEVLIKLD